MAQAGPLRSADAPVTSVAARAPPAKPTIGVTDFYRVEGEEVHEVAVGPGPRRRHRARALPLPVPRRAGVPPRDLARLPAPGRRAGARRRPGQADDPLHRDARRRHHGRPRDRLLPGGRGARRTRVPARALALRAIASSSSGSRTTPATSARSPNDVGFLPTASYCGRLRGDFLNLTRRSVRQPLRPRARAPRRRRVRRGRRAPAMTCRRQLDARVPRHRAGGEAAVGHALGAGAVRGHRARRRTSIARQLGLVGRGRRGPAASSATCARHIPRASTASPTSRSPPGRRATSSRAPTCAGSRSSARSSSCARSSSQLPDGPVRVRPGELRPDHLAVSLVEGWRGEICHVALTDEAGRFAATRSSTRRSTTGPAWRWRCATSRSRTSRSATRASTCRTADTTCDGTLKFDLAMALASIARTISYPRALAAGPPHGPLSDEEPSAPGSLPRPACPRPRPVARAAAAPAPTPVPTGAMVATDGGLALDLGRCLFCTDCTQACPEGAIEFTRDYRLACATAIRSGGELAGARAPLGPRARARQGDPAAVRPIAQAPRR